MLVLCLNLDRTYTFHCRRKTEILVRSEFESQAAKMYALARQFAETHDQEVRKQIEDLSHQRVRMTALNNRSCLLPLTARRAWRYRCVKI
jgi:hypothetical protein